MLIRAAAAATARTPHGVLIATHFSGVQEERDLLTCAHCQHTWAVVPGSGRERGWCRRCGGPTCHRPACARRGCVPFARWLEAVERKGRTAAPPEPRP